MRHFYKQILLFLSPLYIILISYFCLDPFKVLYSYENYYSNSPIQLNRDYISTEYFLKTFKIAKYNSFKFGSSRTLAYNCNTWVKYLEKDSKPFSFDASNENIEGIRLKLELIDKLKLNLTNVLLIICPDVTFVDKNQEHWSIKHPKLKSNKLYFHLNFLLTFFKKGFFVKYYEYKLIGKKTSFNSDILSLSKISWNKSNNDFYPEGNKNMITNDSISYYANEYVFYKRNKIQKENKQTIFINQIIELNNIKTFLSKNGANYKIVISPLYNQLKFHHKDLQLLNYIFDKKNVYDFSGINYLTNNQTNYLENSHYKEVVGNIILDSIYAGN